MSDRERDGGDGERDTVLMRAVAAAVEARRPVASRELAARLRGAAAATGPARRGWLIPAGLALAVAVAAAVVIARRDGDERGGRGERGERRGEVQPIAGGAVVDDVQPAGGSGAVGPTPRPNPSPDPKPSPNPNPNPDPNPKKVVPSTPPSPSTGTLRVYTGPWSNVVIDGVDRGRTPLVIQLAPGRHAYTLTTPDGKRSRGTVEIKAGETVKIFRQLAPKASFP